MSSLSPVARTQLRGRVPGVEEGELRRAAHLDQQCRDELLVAEEVGQVVVHLAGDLGQRLPQGRRLAEGPDHPGRLLHAGDPLAADVPDQEPDPGLRVVAVVEVAADECAVRGRPVAGGHRHASEPGRHDGQDRPLGRLGHGGDLSEPALAVDPHGRDRDRRGGHQDHVDEPHVLLGGAGGALVPEAGGVRRDDGQRS